MFVWMTGMMTKNRIRKKKTKKQKGMNATLEARGTTNWGQDKGIPYKKYRQSIRQFTCVQLSTDPSFISCSKNWGLHLEQTKEI